VSELILHHYDLSPYAEKARLAFGYKGLSWRSVQTPMNLPKPDHFELTGGYRRVPVLQIGADIYCDSHLITRTLDRLHPEPALSPRGRETEELAFSRWAESSFMMLIMSFLGLGGVFDEAFVQDRQESMAPPGTDFAQTAMIVPTKLLQLQANLERLEAQLADGRPYVFGDAPCGADISAFHTTNMFGAHPRTQALLGGAPKVVAWLERVRGIGHGERKEMDAGEAIEIARTSTPAPFEGEPVLPDGMSIGTPVVVIDDEYGSGNVTGTLAASGLHEVAVRREGERAGEVVVHFPRETFTVIRTG